MANKIKKVWPITIYRNHVCVVQYHSAGQSQNNQTDTVATKRGNLIQTGQEIWRQIFRQNESKKKGTNTNREISEHT